MYKIRILWSSHFFHPKTFHIIIFQLIVKIANITKKPYIEMFVRVWIKVVKLGRSQQKFFFVSLRATFLLLFLYMLSVNSNATRSGRGDTMIFMCAFCVCDKLCSPDARKTSFRGTRFISIFYACARLQINIEIYKHFCI